MPRRTARTSIAKRSPSENALARVRALCHKALNNSTITVAELETVNIAAEWWYAKVQEAEEPSLWLAIGEDHLSGLLALYSLAARCSCTALAPNLSTEARSSYGALRQHLYLQLYLLCDELNQGRASCCITISVVQAVLRTHTLRCYAFLLSEHDVKLQLRCSVRSASAASELLAEVAVVASGLGAGIASEPQARTYREAFRAELRAELTASGVLEQWARLYLSLATRDGAQHPQKVSCHLDNLATFLDSALPCEPELLRDSPCLSYLLSSHLVAVCAALDGGTTYGAPGPAAAEETDPAAAAVTPAFLPLCSPSGGPVAAGEQRRSSDGFVSTVPAQWALSLWTGAIADGRAALQGDLNSAAGDADVHCASAAAGAPTASRAWRTERWRIQLRSPGEGAGGTAAVPPPLKRWVGCASVPPLHTRAAFEVSMRLAAAAVAALGAPQRQPRKGGLRVPVGQAGCLARKALLCARFAYQTVAGAPSVPAWAQGKMEDFWRLLVSAVYHGRNVPGADGFDTGGHKWFHSLLVHMLSGLRVPDNALRDLLPAPSPDVAAALSAGFLPCVERQLRLCDSLKWPPVVYSLVPPTVQSYNNATAAWGQILAHGPRPAVFSLLVSAGKRVRRACSGGTAAKGLFRDAGRVVELLLSEVPLHWLVRLAEAQSVPPLGGDSVAAAAGAQARPAADAASAASAAVTQLRTALSYIATAVVHPLIESLQELADEASVMITPRLLWWVPLLAAAPRCAASGLQLPAGPGISVLLGSGLMQALVSVPEHRERAGLALRAALRALLHLAPNLVVQVVATAELLLAEAKRRMDGPDPPAASSDGGSNEGDSSSGGSSSAGNRPTFPTLQQVLGPGGTAPDAELLAAVTASAAAARSRRGEGASHRGDGAAEGELAQLAAAEPWQAPGRHELPEEVRRWVGAASLLVAPAELDAALLAALPGGCGNPRCTNLAGDSEAGLALHDPAAVQGGGPGCRRRYCCVRCREEHTAAGHGARCASGNEGEGGR